MIHGFINGYSHLITGLRASNNNMASTVLDVFLCAADVYGVPSRLRGDHGTQNLMVAYWMGWRSIEVHTEDHIFGAGTYFFLLSFIYD
jgi:hypothetical protein